MERLILPELGHISRELTKCRPFTQTIPFADALRIVMDAAVPIARVERVRDRRGRRPRGRARRRRGRSTCRRSIARRWTATRSSRRTPLGAAPASPQDADLRRSRVHRPGASARDRRRANASRSRPARRCRRARMPSSWSKRPSATGDRVRVLARRSIRSSTSGAARADLGDRPDGRRAGQIAQSQPHRRARGDGRRRRGRLRAAVGRDPVDRQRDCRTPGAPLGAGTDLRHQPLHARAVVARARRRRRRAAAVRRRHDRRSLRRARRRARARHHRVLRRQLGRRSRPDARRAATPRHGALSRHRRQAGQADGLRIGRRHAGLRHARLSRRRACRTRTCCSCRSCGTSRGCRRGRRDASSCRSRGASSRRPGRHQFYTVRVADGQAEPAFKASGDITSMAHADGYIEIPAQTDAVEAGTMVTVKLFQ